MTAPPSELWFGIGLIISGVAAIVGYLVGRIHEATLRDRLNRLTDHDETILAYQCALCGAPIQNTVAAQRQHADNCPGKREPRP